MTYREKAKLLMTWKRENNVLADKMLGWKGFGVVKTHFFLPDVQRACAAAVEAQCVDPRWRNRVEHKDADAKPCGDCGACEAARLIRAWTTS